MYLERKKTLIRYKEVPRRGLKSDLTGPFATPFLLTWLQVAFKQFKLFYDYGVCVTLSVHMMMIRPTLQDCCKAL